MNRGDRVEGPSGPSRKSGPDRGRHVAVGYFNGTVPNRATRNTRHNIAPPKVRRKLVASAVPSRIARKPTACPRTPSIGHLRAAARLSRPGIRQPSGCGFLFDHDFQGLSMSKKKIPPHEPDGRSRRPARRGRAPHARSGFSSPSWPGERLRETSVRRHRISSGTSDGEKFGPLAPFFL